MKVFNFLLLIILLNFPHTSITATKDSIQNIAFIGSTGNGKSTACNILYSGKTDSPFPVGHAAAGETEKVIGYVSRAKNIRVIDTPGFGDNRFDERHIDSIIRQFTETILKTEDDVTSSPLIDAFVLVTRLTPRATTLKNDLEHVRDLFGTVALKSLILLVVYSDGIQGDAKSFMRDLKEMKEVNSVLEEGKKEKANENWFVVWDNRNWNVKQEKELLDKIGRLESYTHEKFIEADNEIKNRIDANLKEVVKKESERLKKELKEDKHQLEEKLLELNNRYEQERMEHLKEREKATEFAKSILKKFGPSLSKTIVGGGIGYKIGMMFGPIGGAIGGLLGGITGNLMDL